MSRKSLRGERPKTRVTTVALSEVANLLAHTCVRRPWSGAALPRPSKLTLFLILMSSNCGCTTRRKLVPALTIAEVAMSVRTAASLGKLASLTKQDRQGNKETTGALCPGPLSGPSKRFAADPAGLPECDCLLCEVERNTDRARWRATAVLACRSILLTREAARKGLAARKANTVPTGNPGFTQALGGQVTACPEEKECVY